MSSSTSLNAPETPGNASVLATAPPAPKPSDWSPLRNPVFRAMWIASAVSYIGFEVRNTAAPLLMLDFQKTFIGVKDSMTTLTQTASALPIFLLVLIAGALADVLDRRRLLIVTHLWMMVAAGILGVLTILHLMTPWLLLAFLFAIGAGFAMMNPAFLAVLPELVEPRELRSALALNSVSLNVARVLGPAIGGLVIVAYAKLGHSREDVAAKGFAFLITSISVLGVCWVLWRWEPTKRQKPAHPESIWGAIRGGFRYASHSPRVAVILGRVFLFVFFAGIMPTFSAIIGRKVLKVGDTGVTIMMACLGAGAVVGVYYMQPLQRRMGVERSVALCTGLYGLAMLGVALTPNLILACMATLLAGFNWVIVPTNFNIAIQTSVPAWIKGRAMGMYVLVLWGSMAAGPAFFGKINDSVGPRRALAYAAVGELAAMLAIVWLRLVPKKAEDFAPAGRGLAELEIAQPATGLEAGVRVSVEYRVEEHRHEHFRNVMSAVRRQRLRNGAAAWELRNENNEGVFTEHYSFPSWSARFRHHERTTKADAALQDEAVALHAGESAPTLRHSAIPPFDATAGGSPWVDTVGSGVSRGLIQFFERMDRAHERDVFRFQPRPGVKILPSGNRKSEK